MRITLSKVIAVVAILAMVAGLRYLDQNGMLTVPDAPTVEFNR